MTLRLNGKPFDAKKFQDSVMEQVLDKTIAVLRERIGSIREPHTGEFPTIEALGNSLENLRLKIEGSPKLLALVRDRLGAEHVDIGPVDYVVKHNTAPKVFLSYAWEDKEIADYVANQLMIHGIDTWWAEWEMKAGDSLRKKIDDGLTSCTHFIVILSPTSVQKPWVNQEMDAGLVRKLNDNVTFIPLRYNFSASDLPPLLASLISPTVEKVGDDLGQLISDIKGISRKPALGKSPHDEIADHVKDTGRSLAATALIKFFVENTKNAGKFDPWPSIDEIKKMTSLTDNDLTDAIFELNGYVTPNRDSAYPEENLFASFDQIWMPWNPADDALKIATDMINDNTFPESPALMAERYGWKPRRLNPALAYLASRELVENARAMDGTEWIMFRVSKTDATRRFVQSRAR